MLIGVAFQFALITILSFFVTIASSSNQLIHPKYNHRDGKLLAKSYFIEFKEGTTNTAQTFTDLTHKYHIENDIKIRTSIDHKFLNAVSIEIVNPEKESILLHIFMNDNNVESITPISIMDPVDFSSPEVEYRTPVKSINNLTSTQLSLISPHHVSQVDRVHHDLNITGEGLFIGIIDSGVDYTHPALGGGFGEGYKIIAGYDLVGNHWNSSDPNSKPEPKNNPLDNCGKKSKATGHGTHVSGIIAGYDASNNFTGVAPGAKLGMWRVFSCGGSAHNDIVIEAMLMAYDAGVHILSMSLGSGIPWSSPKDIQPKLVSKISASGVSVVISAGNNGRKGAFTTGAPGNSESAFEVASVNNEYLYFDGLINVTGFDDPIGFNFPNGTNLTMPDGYWAPTFDKSMNGNLSSDACSSDTTSDRVKGKIALVKRGGCDFIVKIDNVKEAGGIGVIIYEKDDTPFQSSILVKDGSLPIYFISRRDGMKLATSYNQKSQSKMTFTDGNELQFIKSPFSKAVSTFSSVGPSADLDIKPNIAAVGQLIYSTVPQYMGSWGIKQGTSMACPYVAGSIALYLQYHGKNKTSRRTVHELFQNYATQVNLDNTTSGYLDNPVRQGAGLIQVYDTIMQSVHASPAQLSFNDTFTSDYKTHSITLHNYGSEEVSYRLYNNVSVSVEPIRQIDSGKYFNNHPAHTGYDYADITFSEDQILVKPGENYTIQVTVHPPSTDPTIHVIYGGFIQFNPIILDTANNFSANKPIHVSYFGIVGSQRDLPIFDSNVKKSVVNNGTDTTYKINDTIIYDYKPPTDEEKPTSLLIKFNLFSPTLIVKGEVIDSSQEILGYAFQPLSYVQRDFYKDKKPRPPLVWNGQYFKTLPYDVLNYSEESIPKIPQDEFISTDNGNYTLRISALKQFGDQHSDDDWESFTIGPIVVSRLDKEEL